MQPNVEEWLDSPAVRRAVRATGWRATGDTVALLEEVLRQADAPPTSPLDSVDDATRQVISEIAGSMETDQGCQNVHASQLIQSITMLLDCGALPEYITAAGFPAKMVAHVHSRHHPWRGTALAMARAGRTNIEINLAHPGVRWSLIARCLASHGFDGSKKEHMPAVDEATTSILDALLAEGTESNSSIAARLGVKQSRVATVRYQYFVKGNYPAYRAAQVAA